ncbi:hypothetical protein ACWDLG_37515 [Nonomuraea sp. NPDC003727]
MGERGRLTLRVLRGAALTVVGFALPTAGVWLGVRTGLWDLAVIMSTLGGFCLITGPVWHAPTQPRKAQAAVALLALGVPVLPAYCLTLKEDLAFGDLTRYGTTAVCQVRSATVGKVDEEVTSSGAPVRDYVLACPGGQVEHSSTSSPSADRTLKIHYDPEWRTTAVMTDWDYRDHADRQRVLPWYLAGLVAATGLSWALAARSPDRPRRRHP